MSVRVVGCASLLSRVLDRGALVAMLIAVIGCGRLGYEDAAPDASAGMDARAGLVDGADSAGEAPLDAGGPAEVGGQDAARIDAALAAADAGEPLLDAGGPADAGEALPDAGEALPDAASTCECTPGALESCTGCPGGGTRRCGDDCRWQPCVTDTGEPCGSCTTGAFYCALPAGSGWTCEGGRWRCDCACLGPPACC